MKLSLTAARALHLAAQGLDQPPTAPAGKEDVRAVIQRMAGLQIDTISVVARSPYLVLWSRLGAFQPSWLDELLAEGRLFEYWSHAACFLPIEDFPLYRRDMLDNHPRARAWLAQNGEVADQVLKRVRERGEARSAEFERLDGRGGGWWDWKPEKSALECLYSTGELMIARRDPNFHRVYAPRERVLPHWSDWDTPSPEQTRRALTLKAVRALGVARARWVPDYFKMPARGISLLLEELAREGDLMPVTVEGWNTPAYVHPENRGLAEAAVDGRLRPSLTTLLSPFDPLVWDRARALEMFGFEYRIETYTPAAKRRYGYFTLPILHRGSLVGRLDPKAHRKEGVLEVRALHLEPGVAAREDLIAELRAALSSFAAWQGLQQLVVRASDPPYLVEALAG